MTAWGNRRPNIWLRKKKKKSDILLPSCTKSDGDNNKMTIAIYELMMLRARVLREREDVIIKVGAVQISQI